MEHASWVTKVAPPGAKLILAYMWCISHVCSDLVESNHTFLIQVIHFSSNLFMSFQKRHFQRVIARDSEARMHHGGHAQ